MAEEDIKMALEGKKMERDFSRVIITLDNILIPDDKLNPSPSVIDGLSHEAELDLRIYGCELIQTAGILLNLPQVFKRHLNFHPIFPNKIDILKLPSNQCIREVIYELTFVGLLIGRPVSHFSCPIHSRRKRDVTR